MQAPPAVALVTIAACLALSGCSRRDASPPVENRARQHVTTTPVIERSTPRILAIPGEVRAADRALLAARIAGSVEEISVTLGRSVHAGEILARLTAPELSAQAERARIAFTQAGRELARDRQLLEGGVTTDDTVKSGEERLRATRAALDEAVAMLAYTEIKAPFAGRVASRPASRGDLVLPGQPLLTLDREGSLKIYTHVPASLGGSLQLGASLRVRSGTAATDAIVAEISASADPATRTIEVVLTLPDPAHWLPGQSVTVELSSGVVNPRLVPANAIRMFGQMENAFVVSDGRAQLRIVQTGPVSGDLVEILSGLEPGERVITAPAATLRDGQPVQVTP